MSEDEHVNNDELIAVQGGMVSHARQPIDRRHSILSSPSAFEECVELSRRLQQQHLAGILLGRYVVSPPSSPGRNRGGSSDSAELGSSAASEPDTHSYLGPQPNERRVLSPASRPRAGSAQSVDDISFSAGRRRRNSAADQTRPNHRFPDFSR